MIEATCAACGSTQRFPEADGGKMSSCAKCKARITVPRPLPSIPAPSGGGGTGDVINLSDLPAPKRPSPLAGAPKPPPPSPAGRKPALPPSGPPTIDMDSIDLPAPGSADGLIDLPAPVGPSGTRGLTDLPAPVGPTGTRGLTDLPAPVGRTATRGLTDLPAPVGPTGTRGLADLPAPVGPTATRGLTDLPAPRGPSPAQGATPPPAGAPPARGAAPPAAPPARGLDPFTDLPAPKRGGPAVDDSIDLLAPRGAASFDGGIDLPAPVAPMVDLPAPKGFFDDLPAPRGAAPTAGPRPSGGVDLPAPKGFFDDLPAPRGATPEPGGLTPKPQAGVDLPAPKGFFDDLPGPRGAAPSPAPGAGPKPRSMDLDDLDLAPPTQPPQPRMAPPTGAAQAKTAGPVPLDLGGGPDVPPLELDAPSDRYGGLDLPSIHPPGTDAAKAQAAAQAQAQTQITGGGGVTFKAGGSADPVQIHVPKPGALDLEIDDTKRAERPGGRAAKLDLPGVTDKPVVKPKMDPKKRRAILLAVLAVVAIGGGGGFFLFKRWKDQKNRVELRDKNLTDARRLLLAGSAKHWAAAADAAEAVLEIDGGNADALGIAAQAYVAGYLEEGTSEAPRRKASDRIVDQIHAKSARGAQVDKGLAIYGVINLDAASAVEKLAELSKAGKDPDASLYLGWAYAELRQWDDAIAAFSTAADAKNRAVVATYHMGLAQLAKGDLAAAKASFSTVNDLSNHAHLGAQVGIQAAMPSAEYARRETELMSILALKEIAKADPRVVAWAWTLAGDDARRAGRLDAAKDRYAKALDLQPEQLGATVGSAEIALREDRLDNAKTLLDQALEAAPDDANANLAMVDLLIHKGQPSEAESALIKLRAMTLATTEQKVRMHMLDGVHLEKLERFDEAVQAYADAQAATDAGDIGPSVAEATLLGAMSAKARDAGQADKAADYAARSTKLLEDLQTKAKDDPTSQLALGRAFLAAGNGAKAEEYLRKALLARPDDIEANYQLVDALQLQGKVGEAAAAAMVAFKLDPSRTDLALKLAGTLEEAGRFEDASKIFEQLVIAPDVTANTRIKAGLFWTHHGAPDKGGLQGDAVVKADPKNAAGQYLQGEAAYALQQWDEARKQFQSASENDTSAAIYFEALARASWKVAENNEPQYFDKALVAYEEAVKLDPKMVTAQLGRARLHMGRNEWPQALEAYQAALDLAPNAPEIPYGIGVSLHETSKPREALPWLLKAVKLTPTADAYYRIGRIYEDTLDEPRKAAPAYEQASRLAIQDERDAKPKAIWLMDALYRAGNLAKDAGDERTACRVWETWLARDPQNAQEIQAVKVAMQGMHC